MKKHYTGESDKKRSKAAKKQTLERKRLRAIKRGQ